MTKNARRGRNVNPFETAESKNVEQIAQPEIINTLAQEKKTAAVSGSNGNRSSNSAEAAEKYSPYDVIFSLMAALDKTELRGNDALDEAVQICSNGKFQSAQEVIDQLVSDCASTNGDSDTFLRNFCGIIIDNEDTGAITGYDAGYAGIKTAESVVPENGTRDTSFTDNEFTIKNFTFRLEKDFSELTDDEKFIWQSLYSYWAEASLNLLEESYGYTFEDDDITVNSVTLRFIDNAAGGTLAETLYWDNDGDGTVDEMDMVINTGFYNSFADDDQDGVSPEHQSHLDRTFAHELTHAVMNAKIKYRYELPMFISEGMAEITHGIDDVRKRDLQRLAANSELLKQSLVLNPDYHTLSGITAPDYSGGYIFLRYLAWQSADLDSLGLEISNSTAETVVSGSRFSDFIFNSGASAQIYGYDGDDTLTNNGRYATLSGGEGNDFIDNRATGSFLDAGEGDDSINNTGTNVTIRAGYGDDTINNAAHANIFLYSEGDGNDFITGFNENDTLEIQSGSFVVSLTDNDALISLTSGEVITLNGAANTNLNIQGENLGDITLDAAGESYRNTISSATIRGGAGSDSITNYGAGSVILTGDGEDTVYNFAENVYVDGGHEDDYIYNSSLGSGATITAGHGDDTIHINGSANVRADSSDGDDRIYVDASASSVTVDNGAGNDTVFVQGASFVEVNAQSGDNVFYFNSDTSEVTLNAGDGNDSVNNWVSGAQISLSGGSNTLSNSGSSVSAFVGAGDNYLANAEAATSVTISTGAGNDTLNNFAANLYFLAEAGDNRLFNRATATNATVSVGAGNDTLNNYAANLNFISESGDNYLYNEGASATLSTGSGNNTVMNTAAKVLVDTGNGDDVITNAGAGVTVNAGHGKNAITNLAAGAVITAGDGDDSVYSSAVENVTIRLGSGANTVNSNASNSNITTGGGDDFVYLGSSATSVVASLGDGANTLNSAASNITVSSGAGNDFLQAAGLGVSLSAGSGDNTIRSFGGGATLRSGVGNDFLLLNSTGSNAFIFSGGTDYVYGISSSDSIFVEGDTYEILDTNEGHSVISLESGMVVVIGGMSYNFTVDTIEAEPEPTTVPPEPTETSIVSLSSGDDFYSNFEDNVTIHALAGNDTVENSGSGVVIFGEEGDDSILNSGSGNVFAYATGDGNDIIYGVTEADTITISGDFTYGTDGDNAVIQVGTGAITLDGAAQLEININGEIYKAAEDTETGVISLTGGDDFYFNETDNVTIHALAGNDTVENSASGVVIFGEEGDDSILNSGSGNVFAYATGDGNDIIYGVTENDTITISGNFTYGTDGDNAVIQVGTGAITLDGAAQLEININGEIYKAAEDTDTLPAGISISGSVMTVTKDFTGDSVAADEFDSAVTKVDASKLSRGISIVGSAAANSLRGGSGADTISGLEGNDTLTGGGGSDIFMYSADSDVITDYAAGQDKISVSGSIASESLSGSSVVLKIGTGSLTITNGKGKEITVIDSAGNETTREYAVETVPAETETLLTGLTYNSTTKVLTVDNDYESAALEVATLAAESAAKTVDASALTSAIKITGTKNPTALTGGKGNDTLIGGTGNDTLTGNAGADVFVYTGGNDVIKDYRAGEKDIISLASGSVSSASLSGSNEIFKIGSGAITVTGGKNQEITIGSAIYYNNLVYDAKQTSATLGTAFTGTLKAADYATTVKVIDATAPSKAVYVIGNAQANSIAGGKNNDTLTGGKGNDTLTGGAGADVFIYEAGNDIITDYIASQKDVIKLSSGSVSGATLKSNDLAVKTSGGAFTVKGGKNQEVTIGTAVYYNNLVYDSKKAAMTIGTAQTGTLKATDYATSVKTIDASSLSKAAVVGNSQANTITGTKGADTIYGGTGNDVINGGAANDKLYGDAGNDKLNGDAGNDTLNGGAGNDTLTGGAGADVFIYDGGNDVIADYTAKDKDTVSIGSAKVTGATLKSNDLAVKIGSGAVTIKGAKNQEVTIGSGIYYNNLIYDAKKTSATIGAAQKGTLKANEYDSKIKALDASALSKAAVVGNSQANTITGGKGADSLWGGSGNDKLYGGAGNDKLYGEAGNDTLTGGAGADVFIYEAGKDVIADYSAKEKDTVSIGSAKVTGATLKGSDLSLKIGSGALTVKGAKGQEVTIGSVIYLDNVSYDAKKTAVTLGSAFSGKFDADDVGKKVATIDGSAAAKAINVAGNDSANVITGGKGADTLSGGKGNDMLTGGDGKDVFVYSAGKDVITDYAAGKDTIRIDGAITATKYSGRDVVFTIDDDSKKTLTVKNGNGAKLTISENGAKATTELYSSSNGNATVPWFAEDDTNFIGSASLSEITAEKYSVTQIETASDFETLAQEKISITCVEK